MFMSIPGCTQPILSVNMPILDPCGSQNLHQLIDFLTSGDAILDF